MEEEKKEKGKGGRPRKNTINRKVKTIGVCFSEPEYYALKYHSDVAKLPLSVYCREAILKAEIKEPVKEEEMDVLRKLSGEANNLNQLTRLAHTYGLNTLQKEAAVLFHQLVMIINRLSNDWKSGKRKKF